MYDFRTTLGPTRSNFRNKIGFVSFFTLQGQNCDYYVDGANTADDPGHQMVEITSGWMRVDRYHLFFEDRSM